MNCKNEVLISEAKKLSDNMLLLAEKGAIGCEDDGCLLVFGIIRDCGYKIRRTIREEYISGSMTCDQI